jgi:hypothetical protein
MSSIGCQDKDEPGKSNQVLGETLMEEELQFLKFPSIARLNRDCVITEKIDGTNSQIVFSTSGNILCGSRNRQIDPGDDNYGFASWAYANQSPLFRILGPGRHYGEWWGSKIQRKYGLTNEDKRFSLFNSGRWTEELLADVEHLHVVPVLYQGLFSTNVIEETLHTLETNGSAAAPGFMNPEGIVIYQIASKQNYKVTIENDDHGKTGRNTNE